MWGRSINREEGIVVITGWSGSDTAWLVHLQLTLGDSGPSSVESTLRGLLRRDAGVEQRIMGVEHEWYSTYPTGKRTGSGEMDVVVYRYM